MTTAARGCTPVPLGALLDPLVRIAECSMR
jgi:hypothetical protein